MSLLGTARFRIEASIHLFNGEGFLKQGGPLVFSSYELYSLGVCYNSCTQNSHMNLQSFHSRISLAPTTMLRFLESQMEGEPQTYLSSLPGRSTTHACGVPAVKKSGKKVEKLVS